MIINPENKGEKRTRLTINMRFALLGLCVSSITFLAKKHAVALPFEINGSEAANYLSVTTLTFAVIKFCAGNALLPKEPEKYMVDNAIRLRRDGQQECLTSLVSVIVNNGQFISTFLK